MKAEWKEAIQTALRRADRDERDIAEIIERLDQYPDADPEAYGERFKEVMTAVLRERLGADGLELIARQQFLELLPGQPAVVEH